MSDGNSVDPAGLVAGRFRVLGLLGSGATASVYETLDTVDGGRVAVKVLHPHLAERGALRDAFLREARTVGGMQHPSLCRVIDFGETTTDGEAEAWTAWEVAPGMTLAEHVRERGPLSVPSAVDMAARVLAGLSELHRAGLVHRDISPANIVIDVDAAGRLRDARVIDFGLVDVVGSTTRGSDVLRSEDGDGVVGNVQYAAPELLRGEGVGPAADLYQLAGVLYFALVGSPPFPRETSAATIRAHQLATPPTASVRVAGVPVAVDRAIVRAMLKDPEARFASADALRAELLAAAVTRTGAVTAAVDRTTRTRVIAAPAPPAPVPPVGDDEPVDRAGSPWIWVLALVSVALVVGVVFAMTSARPEQVARPTAAPTAAATPTSAPQPSATPSVAPVEVASAAVPALEGLDADAARLALEEAGLSLGEVRTSDSARPAGLVLASEPGVGASLQRGGVVSLTVASGSNGVPDVMGLEQQSGADALAAAGFIPATSPQPSASASGTVVAIQPGAGESVPLGSTVVLVVATPLPVSPPVAPSTPTPAPSPSLTPTPGATP
ncbi:serine/threonine protein kinase [Microbacterium sp. P05]|uniref:serine/threonine protein kinase n=1 Tax=Microbacterium sp. P05 TaxID=3366948 RepID=UPI003746D456